MKAELAQAWRMDLERGPDCLIIRLRPSANGVIEDRELADALWRVLQQHLVNRLILEIDDVGDLQDDVLGELVKLSHQICERDGMLRICGLSERNRELLAENQLNEHVAHYACREEAMMRYRPLQLR
jgi:anti-anti-sigma regulatory factor